MFDKEKWQEIFQSIGAHKMRSFLTGFGVAWGIFMLVMLLCVGKGFKNGVISKFSGSAKNSIQVFGNTTSLPYKGLPINRWIHASSEDLDIMKKTIPEIKYITPEVELADAGFISYNNKSGTFTVKAIDPDYNQIEYSKIAQGRQIDPIDRIQKRKVAVIGEKVMKQLFKDKNPIGEYMNIKGNYFMVVGVVIPDTNKIMNFGSEASIFIPYSTYRQTFNDDDKIEHFDVAGDEQVSGAEIEAKVKKYMADKYVFDIKDNRAIWIQNNESMMKGINSLFSGLNIFLWIIGISSLVGGIVGVGNIMLVTVKERTKEIGIRKALGAIPASIIGLVIQESIVITTFAGVAGLLLASGILELIGYFTKSVSFFQHPEIDLNIAVSSIVVLIIAGALAGYIPARNAAKVSPIEALRYE
jgi:putative ABC transport system permease protein